VAEALIDTNVLLRHLLRDDAAQADSADALLERIESGEISGWVTALGIAEAVWVLSGPRLRLERAEVRNALKEVLQIPGLRVAESSTLLAALELFTELNIDFIDAYHGVVAAAAESAVYSFDRDFDRIPGVRRIEP
jgi:predicted nucleic acid-binding protein